MVQTAVIAFSLGMLAASGAAWLALRRYLRRLRSAERRARAAERMAEIGAMTGGLAHEIKNPLSTIGLNAQLLAESVQDLEVAPEVRSRLLVRLTTLRREVDRLRDILADFLAFAGRVRLDAAPTDINRLVDELVDFYLPEAQRHGVRLRADHADRAVTATVDAKLVKQALLNLMINATQAIAATRDDAIPAGPASGGGGWGGGGGGGGAGGAGVPAGELILRTQLGDDAGEPVACVHVIDTGPGIPEATLSRIFDPYFTTKASGSGLGLPTARRLVEEHGGRIDVHSEPGKGSDFVVMLPVRASPTGPER